MSLSIY